MSSDIDSSMERIANALEAAFKSNLSRDGVVDLHPRHEEERNITGGLFAIATALERVADAITKSHG